MLGNLNRLKQPMVNRGCPPDAPLFVLENAMETSAHRAGAIPGAS